MATIGQMRHRLTVERKGPGQNPFGQTEEAWTPVATYWARLRSLTGRELATAREVTPTVSVRVEMRNQVPALDVQPEDRLRHGARIFNILAVLDPEETGWDLVLDCAEWKGAAS